MELNSIFRRTGEPSYTTPLAVLGSVGDQNGGGTIAMINPPFRSQPRIWRKGWAKKFRIGRLYLYVSNCRMKKRPIRDLMCQGFAKDRVIENKMKLYERQGGCCPICGQPFEYDQLELHHILSLSRFPELGQSIRNGIMLCHRCHKEVHCNPYLNIQMMEDKAKEMGIDLTKRYEQ